jgi:hypothetical protein
MVDDYFSKPEGVRQQKEDLGSTGLRTCRRQTIKSGERYPTNAYKPFLLCLLAPLHVSASRCHLQGVTLSLFISYSRLYAFRVGVTTEDGTWKPKHVRELLSTIKNAYEHLLDISHMTKKFSVQRSRQQND